MAEAERSIDVPMRRLPRWLEGFATRHGPWKAQLFAGASEGPSDDSAASPSDGRPEGPPGRTAGWDVVAKDGSYARVVPPPWLDVTPGAAFDAAELAGAQPAYGVVLLRRAGYAVGAFEGSTLVDRKVSTRHIHGRTAAGGWSQQRYARRRANQADEIVAAAAASADRILGSRRGLRFLVTGGDRELLAAVRGQFGPRVSELPLGGHVGVGAPDAAVLAGMPDRILAVRIDLSEA
jgi:hypothetical protein